MFANFIYFIVALLILSLYEPPDELPLSIYRSMFFFLGLALFYSYYARSQFQKLVKLAKWDPPTNLDAHFGRISTRCSILALVLLAVDVWWLHVPAFLNQIRWFSTLPTLNSLLLLLIFMGYLSLLWTFSYDAHRVIYRTDISRAVYVYSNFAFSAPVLIPWILLFGVHDIIRLLPFEWPKQLLDTPIGQSAYFLIFLIVAAIFAPLLIQRFWRCRPLEPGEHRTRIENLCRKAKVRYADIVHWPIFGGRMITAGVMGLVARYRYILVTDALLHLLTPEEVDQVIAHEIGHVKHKHLLLYLLFFIGFMLITYAIYSVTYYLFFFNAIFLDLFTALNLDIFIVYRVVSSAFLIAGVILYFRYLFGFFIRNFERQADIFVFKLFKNAQPLISTFDKIVLSSGQPADKPNWHHFSIKERVDYLSRCERSPVWIFRHNKKVKNSILTFILGIVFIAVSSYQFNEIFLSNNYQTVNVSQLEAYLDQKEIKTEIDAIRYLYIGGIYYEEQNYERAASAYQASLDIKPDNPDALNNFAWLLATEGQLSIYNPQRALELAQKAIALKKAPHIWDTLAQCLYVNGRIKEAVAAEIEALKMNPKDRRIYEDQLNKFRQAYKQEIDR